MKRTLALLASVVLVAAACGGAPSGASRGAPSEESDPAPSGAPSTPPRRPSSPPDAQWQYQLQGPVDRSNPARVFDVDGEATPQATVAALQRDGRYVICYFSAGTYESFRSDSRGFPAGVRGHPVEGFEDEQWLDIRRLAVIAPVLRARMRACASKGFDAVEPDNVDGYDNTTGFPLRRRDALRFTRWLATTAHRLGLAVGLKNSGDLVSALAPRFDFAVVEQCFEYDECARYDAFTQRGKPVYEVEYSGTPQGICPQAARLGINTILKGVDLKAPSRPCPNRRTPG